MAPFFLVYTNFMEKNYWDKYIDDPSYTKEDLFFKIRDQYTSLMKHLYDDPADIPDFRIHFSEDTETIEQGEQKGYPICTLTRRSNTVTRSVIHDVSEIENFESAYTWYKEGAFMVFDFRETGISPFTFITHSFIREVLSMLVTQGFKKTRINMMSELIISTGITEFFYGFYSIDINFIQNLSATTYESNYTNARIYASRTDGRGVRRTRKGGLKVAFVDSVDFTIDNLRQIRKLLELSDDKLALVIGETGKIRGLTAEELLQNECEIRIGGHLAWTITYDGQKTISYNNGHYHIFVPHTADVNLKNFLSTVSDDLEDAQIEGLASVITEASKQVHGTIIVLGDSEAVQKETQRITGAKYGIAISAINLSVEKELIQSITSIDGAVFIDTDCMCSCIGAILDGDFVAKGSLARGSRYNSAHNYILRRSQMNEKFTAIVISEDGTVDAIKDDKVYRINLTRQ